MCVLSTEGPVGGSGLTVEIIFMSSPCSFSSGSSGVLFNCFNIVHDLFFYSWKFMEKSGRGQRNAGWGWPLTSTVLTEDCIFLIARMCLKVTLFRDNIGRKEELLNGGGSC